MPPTKLSTAQTIHFPPGSLVRCREREWVVLPAEGPKLLLLRPLTGDEVELAGVYLPLVEQGIERVEPAEFPPPDWHRRGDLASAHLLWDAARLALRHGAGPLRCLGHISLRPRAYQFVPLLMALRLSPVRLLIADDVGIGKTIEAALIARELLDRGEIRRVAVLCPPYLAEQWRMELATKFHLQAAVVRAGTVAGLARRLPPGAHSIFSHYRHLVVSIDYAKSPRHQKAFLAHCPELVIVDEAHGATAGPGKAQTQRHELVSRVSAKGGHLLLLTATPHSGYQEAFRSLLALVDQEFGTYDFDRLAEEERTRLARHFIQRRRADVQDWLDGTRFPERIALEEHYRLSEDYRHLFRDVYTLARQLVQTGEQETGWRRRVRHWTALALLRCVMSSPAAAVASLQTRATASARDGLSQDIDTLDAHGTSFVLDPLEGETAEDVTPGGLVATGQDEMTGAERRRLRALARRAQKLAGTAEDTKLARLEEIVAGLVAEGYQPIVWCRFIATSDYLAAQLQERLEKRWRDIRVVSITGALAEDERQVRLKELAREPRRVLVATDCLSEGINLQEDFSAVVHYDLPWNPNRLEQREGRVDRFGQKRLQVKAVLLYGRDNAIDGAVLEVLLRKAKEIYRALGTYVPVPVNSETISEAILRALLLRSADGMRQLELLDAVTDLDLHRFHLDWDRAAERERQTRTRFAQRALKPDEVRTVVAETDRVLGDPGTVERFVLSALQRLNVPVKRVGKGQPASWRMATQQLPPAIQQRLGERPSPWRVSFDLPPPEGVETIGRQHPLVTGLAGYLLEAALAGRQAERPVAARSALVRTRAVERRTTLLLLRLRYLLETKQTGPPAADGAAPMLAEEVVVRAFRGGPAEAEWLTDAEVEALLEAPASANVTEGEARDFLGEALGWLGELRPAFQQLLAERAKVVEEAHGRVRRAAGLGTVRARPHELPDVLGIYVLLPIPEARR